VLADPAAAPVSAKMKALLVIAEKVRRDGRLVEAKDIDRARAEGADDKAIHDTVLIAAAFCMFNRYVDGLGTWAPEDPDAYEESGVRLARDGYVNYDFTKG
jgi:alkylhydroperoxidase family enzyme